MEKIFVVCDDEAFAKKIIQAVKNQLDLEIITRTYENGNQKIDELIQKAETVKYGILVFYKKEGDYVEVINLANSLNSCFPKIKTIALVENDSQEKIAKLLGITKIIYSRDMPPLTELDKLI